MRARMPALQDGFDGVKYLVPSESYLRDCPRGPWSWRKGLESRAFVHQGLVHWCGLELQLWLLFKQGTEDDPHKRTANALQESSQGVQQDGQLAHTVAGHLRALVQTGSTLTIMSVDAMCTGLACAHGLSRCT